MPQSCDDISARMMEHLYGELQEAQRATFQTHIAGCARCRAELDGFESTRAMARDALDEPVPARAHAAILRAAAEHLETTRAAAKTTAQAAPARLSFWEWIRTRWTLPTLATVGAVAVVLIGGKLFLDPKKVHERGEQALAPESSATAPAPELPKLGKKHDNADVPLEGTAPAPTDAGGDSERPSSAKSTASGGARAEHKQRGSSAAKPAPAKAAALRKDGRGTAADPFTDLSRERSKDGLGTIGRGHSGGSGISSGVGVGGLTERRQFAPPPPAKTAAPNKPATAAGDEQDKLTGNLGTRPSKKESIDDLLSGTELRGESRKSAPEPKLAQQPRSAPSPVAAPAMAPPPSPAATAAPEPSMPSSKKAKKQKPAMEAEAAEVPAAAAGPRDDNKPSGGAGYGKGSGAAAPEVLIQRAERLYAEGRWIEAAAAFRELLRLDPGNAAAGRWRQRISFAQAQAESDARAAAAREAAPARETAAPARTKTTDSK